MRETIMEHVAVQEKTERVPGEVPGEEYDKRTELIRIAHCKNATIADSLLPILSVIPSDLVSKEKIFK